MIRSIRLLIIAVLIVGSGLAVSANAQHIMPIGSIKKPIPHRLNSKGANRFEFGPIGLSVTKGGTSVANPPLIFDGGQVISTPVIYYIFYGNWNQPNGFDNPLGKSILLDFAKGVGGSPYFRLNSTLSTETPITGNAAFGGAADDNYSQGHSMDIVGVLFSVIGAINGGQLPFDKNGVYFVLTSSDVDETDGFCSLFCGFHTSVGTNLGPLRFAFVGNAGRCLNGCAAQSTGPNGNAGADAAASVVAHELAEATTDPDLDAWFDGFGDENADKCNFTFGHSQTRLPNGAFSNIRLGNRFFLLQRLINHTQTGDFCMMDSTHN